MPTDPDPPPRAHGAHVRAEDRRGRAAHLVVPGLGDSGELFSRVFEEGPVGKAVFGPDMTVRRVNRALCSMLGYSAEELLVLDPAICTHPPSPRLSRLIGWKVGRKPAREKACAAQRPTSRGAATTAPISSARWDLVI